jgi:apolipoprotein N-acyltransferase
LPNPTPASTHFNRWHYLIAFLSGASLTLSFAPFEWRFIAIVAPAILFFLLHQANTYKHHLKLSYLFAVGMFGTGISWLFYSMYFFADAHFLLAGGFTLLFVVLISLTFLLLGTLTYRLQQSPVFLKLILFLPASWVLIEWFRNWFVTGFPWLYLGYSHIDNWLINIAPITGSLGVSMISSILSGALVLIIIGQQKQRIMAVVITATILGTSYSLGKIEWTTPIYNPIKVSLLQGNIPQEEKWLPKSLQPTLDLYQDMTAESWDSDLIIWPETAIPGYFRDHMDDIIQPLQSQLEDTQTDLLIGGFYYNESGTPGSENSILAITSGYRSIYSKQHRVPFSEYIPFLSHLRWLNKWIQLPYDSVKKGTGSTTLQVAGVTARMSVCYEDAYGDETIKGLPEANILINVSNDGWFTGSIEPQQHMEIARMRAVETGRYMLRGTNIGVSGIIDQKGKIIATAPAYITTIIDGEAQPYTGATPYVRVGNWLIIIISSALVLFGLFLSARQQN